MLASFLSAVMVGAVAGAIAAYGVAGIGRL
jgi:hypothetical protein